MKQFIEIKLEDLTIRHMETDRSKGGMWTGNRSNSIILYHKPTDTTIKCDRHSSQHKNKCACITILKDLLTDIEEGDIVYASGKTGLVIEKGFNVCTVEFEEGLTNNSTQYIDRVAHTKEGYIYITTLLKEDMLAECYKDIDRLNKEIKELNNAKD